MRSKYNIFEYQGTKYTRVSDTKGGRFDAVLLNPTPQEIELFGVDAIFNFKLTEVDWI